MLIAVSIAWLLIGLVALVIGGDWLVRSASKLALLAGMTPLVVGLTVVAFGTSAPELAVSVVACTAGESDLALGNVVGSNLFNTFFILGASALIVPLMVSERLVWFDVPVMIALSVALPVLAWDGSVSRSEGIGLMVGLGFYIASLFRASKRLANESPDDVLLKRESRVEQAPSTLKVVAFSLIVLVAGLVLLIAGSQAIVHGAVTLARLAGMSELLIGMTIVAAGTSLPEVAASMIAAAKGEREIAVGNVVGSNIFNIAMVLGMSATVSGVGLEVSPAIWERDLAAFVISALVCLPIFATAREISRWEGGLLLLGYVLFLTVQILVAIQHPQARLLEWSAIWIVVPLVGGLLLISWGRHWIQSRRARRSEISAEA